MSYKNNRICKILNIDLPLIQAPMSWITDEKLVSSVSNAGGLGILGPSAGQTEITTNNDEIIANMQRVVEKTHSLTDKPFGINLIIPFTDSQEELDFTLKFVTAASEAGISIFSLVGVANKMIFDHIKKHRGIIIHRPATPTIANMQEAQAWGADILVATGYDEGSHLPSEAIGTFTIIPTIADNIDVPLLAAGGINDHRGVKAAFALGAEGVFIGTRFIVTQESPASIAVKEKIIHSGIKDIVFASPMQRSIRNRTTDYLNNLSAQERLDLDLDREINKRGGLRTGMLLGDENSGIISVNTGIVYNSNITLCF